MKLKTVITFALTVSLAVSSLAAQATNSYNVAATNSALEVNLTSTSTWTAETGFPGNRMAFNVSVGVSQDIDIVATFVNPPSGLATNGQCALNVPFSPVSGESLSVATFAKDANSVTCRVSYGNWPSNMGRSFDLIFRADATTQTNRHASAPVEIRNLSAQQNQPSSQNPSTPAQNTPQSAKAPNYSGPQFEDFGSAVLAGNKLVTSGRKLDSISSMKINGESVAYKINSASELEIEVPKDLAPGKYDIEITSIHGKLTHLQAFTVKAVVPTKTLQFRGDGSSLGYEELLELTKMAKEIGPEYTSVKCIVNAADAALAQRLLTRGCDYVGAIRLRGKAVSTEAKSTYKGDGFWFKIVANG